MSHKTFVGMAKYTYSSKPLNSCQMYVMAKRYSNFLSELNLSISRWVRFIKRPFREKKQNCLCRDKSIQEIELSIDFYFPESLLFENADVFGLVWFSDDCHLDSVLPPCGRNHYLKIITYLNKICGAQLIYIIWVLCLI